MNWRYILLPLVVVASMLLAIWARTPPVPDGASGYDVSRAQAIVAEVAKAPHPVGTPEHARVRQWLVSELTTLGLIVTLDEDMGVRQAERRKGAISVSPVSNIIAILPGRDRTKPAVALMAHYDSAPWAPGAADDGAGLAAVLETARVLSQGPQPARDTVFLITDAEELGLLGAQAFFNGHPLATRVGAVVNVEARGSRGRAFMFQTSTGNRELVSLWAKSANNPSGNSMAGDVYRLLPNDTDLSVSLAKGIVGINAAFVDGLADYHMPTDAPRYLDKASLAHLGDFALTTTRALAMADTLPDPSAGDATYFDVFGAGVVRYPVGWGWGLIAIAAGLFAFSGFHTLGVSWWQAIRGALGALVLTVGIAALAHGLGSLLYGTDTLALRERVFEMDWSFWVYILLLAGIVFFVRPARRLWIGATLMTLVCAVAAQIWLPGAAWLFAWPALIGALLIWLAARHGEGSRLVMGVSFIVGGLLGAMLLQGVISTFVSIEPMTSAVVALIVPFTLMLIGPLMQPYADKKIARWLGGGLVVLALAGAGVLALNEPYGPRHPKPGDLFHWTEGETGKSYWVSTSRSVHLTGTEEKVKPVWARHVNWRRVPAPAFASPPPQISFAVTGSRATLRVASAVAPRMMAIMLKPDAALLNARVNGKAVSFPKGEATRISWRAQMPGDLVVEFDKGSGGKIALDTLYALSGLPPGAPDPGGPVTDWTYYSGSRVVTGKKQLAW